MMLAAPCTHCHGPVDPPRRRGRPRLWVGLCRVCRVWAYRQTEKYSAKEARSRRSPSRRAAIARWKRTAKGRANAAAREALRSQTDERRAYRARYHQTDKYRAVRVRYEQSDLGRAQLRQRAGLRRARKRNARILEPVDRRTIFALDAGLCHLCDLPVDAQAFHIDHVIPISVDAIEAEFNCAVAHPSCNIRKQARTLALSPSARARWQARRPEHLALLDEHFTRLAA